jgi:hypothetical protein
MRRFRAAAATLLCALAGSGELAAEGEAQTQRKR